MSVVLNKKTNAYELDGDFAVQCMSTDFGCKDHTHEYTEMVYCFSGEILNYVDGNPYVLKKGDLLIIKQNAVHSLHLRTGARYCDIMFKKSFFEEKGSESEELLSMFLSDEIDKSESESSNDRIMIHFSTEDQKKIEFLIKTTEKEQRFEGTSSVLIKRSALNMILALVFRYIKQEIKLTVDADLLKYIRDHCSMHLTLDMFAKKCFYTNEHFSRKFKKVAGKTFTRYLNDCRFEKAEYLLLRTRKTVDVVFEECGFTSRGEFFKKFEERYGQTPVQFRKNQKSVQT